MKLLTKKFIFWPISLLILSAIRFPNQKFNSNWKKRLHKNYFLKNNNDVLKKLQDIKNEIRLTLENSKTKHYFKVPCISQIIHSNDFITGFAEKSKLFNTFFAQQCSLIENSSTLPSCIFPKLDKSLSTIYFSEEDPNRPK